MGHRALYLITENGEEKGGYFHWGANELSPFKRLKEAMEKQRKEGMSNKSIYELMTTEADGQLKIISTEELYTYKKDFEGSSDLEMRITLDLDRGMANLEYSKNFNKDKDDFSIKTEDAMGVLDKTFEIANEKGIDDFWEVVPIFNDQIKNIKKEIEIPSEKIYTYDWEDEIVGDVKYDLLRTYEGQQYFLVQQDNLDKTKFTAQSLIKEIEDIRQAAEKQYDESERLEEDKEEYLEKRFYIPEIVYEDVLRDDLKELIREEYQNKGWTAPLQGVEAPEFWDRYYETINNSDLVDKMPLENLKNRMDKLDSDLEKSLKKCYLEESVKNFVKSMKKEQEYER